MKLMWFHLMPYTELPDDFNKKHPSVWVDIHSSLFDPRRAHHMYNDFLDELEHAAGCGFDAVCVNEHHSNGYGLMPSPNLIASSLARCTIDTAICAAVPSRRGSGAPRWTTSTATSATGYKAGQATMSGFWNEMARPGKDRNPYRIGFLQFVGVGESRQHAFDLYVEAAECFYGRCLHVDARWAAPPGYFSEGSQRVGIQSQVQKAAGANVLGSTSGTRFNTVAREMNAIVDNGYVIVGSPDEVVEQLREVADSLNVGHL